MDSTRKLYQTYLKAYVIAGLNSTHDAADVIVTMMGSDDNADVAVALGTADCLGECEIATLGEFVSRLEGATATRPLRSV